MMTCIHHPGSAPSCQRRSARGFSLIELMIAVAILAIITSIAFPSFMDSMRKGRRSEAVGAIANVQQAQERFRGRSATYADLLIDAPTASPPGLGIPATTANGRYSLVLSGATATGYIIIATATGSQASDTKCKLLGAQLQGGTLTYGSGTSSVDWTDPNGCWSK